MARPHDIAMCPRAITRRLKEVFELNRLCRILGMARPLGPAEPPDPNAPPDRKPPRDRASE